EVGQDDPRAGRDGLNAADPAARAGAAVGDRDDVAQFSGVEVLAAVQLAAQDQPGADPGPDGDADEVGGRVRPPAGHVLAERGRVGVVQHPDRQAELLLEHLAELGPCPGQVRGLEHQPGGGVDPARCGDTQPGDDLTV